MQCDIAGSYRRKLSHSGDVDVIMTGEQNNMSKVIQDLSVIRDSFVFGKTKWMGIAIFDKLPRRLDIMYTNLEEYPFALLYFTGSQDFNEKFRGYARTLGYTINEHEIKHLDNRKVNLTFTSEKDIFAFLNLPYTTPENRISFVAPKKSPKKTSASVKLASQTAVYNVAKGVTLADTYDEKKHKPVGMLMSEKYDGVRAIWNGKELRTRANKKIYAPSWFISKMPKDVALDGELFTERGRFQDAVSIVKKYDPINSEWRKITFKIFDSPSLPGTYIERYQAVKTIVNSMCSTPCAVDYVRQTVVTTLDQMETLYKNVSTNWVSGLVS